MPSLGLLALLVAPAHSAEVGLGVVGGYRGYFDEVEGAALREQLFEEGLRAELDTALINRALAAWNVGFALDHTMTVGPGARTRVLGYRYNTDLQLWEDGLLPVRLFGSRQRTSTLR